MKIEWNSKYNTIAMYAFLVICSSIFLYVAASQLDVFIMKVRGGLSVLKPFIIGGSLAYLLNFIMVFIEKKLLKVKLLKKASKKQNRAIAMLFTYFIAFTIIYLFLKFVLPQLVSSIIGLVNNIPMYVTNTTKLVNGIVESINLEQQYLNIIIEKWNEFVEIVIKFLTDMVPVIGNTVVLITSSIFNILVGIIVSIYLLADKERFIAITRKLTYSILTNRAAARVLTLAKRSNETFGRFISGKLLNSLIIGVLTFVVISIFNMPYKLLISVIVGITNVIPFFGPFFGAIPSTIIILFVSPVQALWFMGIILVIQQIDGNIIGPKILGDSLGISAFWILFSLLIFSKMLGFVGMIVGVPIFAVIYTIVKELVESKLVEKGLPTATEAYDIEN